MGRGVVLGASKEGVWASSHLRLRCWKGRSDPSNLCLSLRTRALVRAPQLRATEQFGYRAFLSFSARWGSHLATFFSPRDMLAPLLGCLVVLQLRYGFSARVNAYLPLVIAKAPRCPPD